LASGAGGLVKGKGKSLFGRPRGLAIAVLAAVLAGLTWVAAAGASALPTVRGPELRSETADSNPFGPCLFLAQGFNCYGPDEIAAAYDYPPRSDLDGTGQTIMIVDAYQHPLVLRNLRTFDALFGIPNPSSVNFVQVNGPSVTSSGSGDVDGWGVETALDVQWAHAMAPGARIVLVQAASDDDANIAAALAEYIPQYPGAIISQSYGEPETFTGSAMSDYRAAYETATSLGDTILASAGDWGATFTPVLKTTSPAYASYPASDPLVTGVGGTQGLPYGDGLLVNGHYGGEQVWNEPDPAIDSATGGAPSVLFSAPPWQRSASAYKTRSTPDVSYNAAVNGGVYVIHTVEAGANAGRTFIYLVGGTSAGTPQWAAIFALANQARGLQGEGPIGWANATLGKIGSQNRSQGAFHDITVGNDALDSPNGYAAGPGFDLATGWGTPDVSNLIPALVSAPAMSNPAAGSPAHLAPGATTGKLRPHTMVPGG
jgi:subtilase family serine protease